MRSGYFLRMFVASWSRFSNRCFSLNIIFKGENNFTFKKIEIGSWILSGVPIIAMSTYQTLFIPTAVPSNVPTDFAEVYIAIAFEQQRIAKVSHVSVTESAHKAGWYAALIRVDQWYNTSKAKAIRRNAESLKTSTIYHAPNKYWRVHNTFGTPRVPPPSQLRRCPAT